MEALWFCSEILIGDNHCPFTDKIEKAQPTPLAPWLWCTKPSLVHELHISSSLPFPGQVGLLWAGCGWCRSTDRLDLWDPGTSSSCQALPVMPNAFASVSLSSNLNLSVLLSSQFLHKLRNIISFRCLECSRFGWNWLVVSKFREKPRE